MIKETIRTRLTTAPPLGAKIKFDFGDKGFVILDGTGPSPVISQENQETNTTMACSIETFEKILQGTQDPTMAYMSGALKITGSMGYAMKLSSLLED